MSTANFHSIPKRQSSNFGFTMTVPPVCLTYSFHFNKKSHLSISESFTILKASS